MSTAIMTEPPLLDNYQTAPYSDPMARVIGFRPTPDDLRILEQQAWPGETMSDTLRRALRFMDREAWLEQARADARRLKDEDLGTDPDAW